MIEQLRYVRLAVEDLAAATAFAVDVLGLQREGGDDVSCALRSDKRAYTLMLVEGAAARSAIGLAVRDVNGLEALGARLKAHGLDLRMYDPDEAARRGARAAAAFDDHSGNAFELVVRPMDSGWRVHTARDSGVTGLEAVAVRSTDVVADQALWTEVFGARVADWAGDAAYLAFNDAHHCLALHPSPTPGVLAVEYAVENVDLLMQNSYFLQAAQVRILHGPGRRPTSGQLFLTFESPMGAFSFVTEGDPQGGARRPRQFPDAPASFDAWGSENRLPDGLCAATAREGRP